MCRWRTLPATWHRQSGADVYKRQVLDKVTVDYYGAPTPIQQVASVAVSEARTLTITPWDLSLIHIYDLYTYVCSRR